MKTFKVTVYVWGQPPYIVTITADNYGIMSNSYVFYNKNTPVAQFPQGITSIELVG